VFLDFNAFLKLLISNITKIIVSLQQSWTPLVDRLGGVIENLQMESNEEGVKGDNARLPFASTPDDATETICRTVQH